MSVSLFDWQKPSADKLKDILSRHNVAVDASDTGAGKTYIALDTIKKLEVPFLVVCPKAVRSSWEITAADFGLTPLDIVTPQKLQFKNPYFANNEWNLPDNAMIIWDEIQQGTSGPNTKTTKALARTKVYGIPVLALSATIADSPLKMRGLGFLLGLHDFNTSSFKRWCLTRACYPSPFAYGKLEFSKGRKGKEAVAKIHASIRDRMVRIKREDIPDFPEGHVIAKLVDLDKEYTDQINEAYDELDDRLKQPGSNELVERLHAREKTECLKVPMFLDRIQEALDEGTSPVIFLNFHSSREKVVSGLHDLGIKDVSQIHGKMTSKEQQEAKEAFQNNTNRVCVVMSQAGGAGISLHDVHGTRPRVSFLTPSDKAVDMLQCLGRIHRACGTKVTQTFLLAAGTIEEKVYRNIQRKIANISTLNDGDLDI